jgi:hypothetical protein
MGIFPYELRPADSVQPTVIADSLRDGEDVVLVKRPIQRCAAVAASTKADQLTRVIGVGTRCIVLLFKFRQVCQKLGLRGASGHRM